MPITFTEYFKINEKEFPGDDFFNCILDVDSNYFINFQLLKETSITELRASYFHIQERFRKIIKLLINTKNNNDIFYRKAVELIKFNEVPGTCLGYSSSNTLGSGIGKKYSDQIINSSIEIIKAGIKDPEFFEILGLIEVGIGADRISDMITNIILNDLLNAYIILPGIINTYKQ